VKNLKDSIKFKVSTYAPNVLSEAYRLTGNFEQDIANERSNSRFNKRHIGYNMEPRFSKTRHEEGQDSKS